MNLKHITPLILTWNEEPNLRRCLEGLSWAERILVVDSGSDDATREICEAHGRVEFVVRPFDNHTNQWNHGLSLVRTPRVLSLDADYVVGGDFVRELERLDDDGTTAAWSAGFRYLVQGRPLRASLYPPRDVLFDPARGRYLPDGHTQRLHVEGPRSALRTRIDHDDRKPLTRWLDSQKKYALLEAEKLRVPDPEARLPDRIRRWIWPAAPAALAYTLLVKGTLLDGWAGIYYALQRTYAELLLSLVLLERKIRTGNPPTSGPRPCGTGPTDPGDNPAPLNPTR